MSCTVTTQGILSETKQQLLDIGGVTPAKTGVFENYTKDNPNTISDKLKDKLDVLKDLYQNDKYGNMFKTSRSEYGTEVTITPSQRLADAMTMQNFEDDAKSIQREDAKRASIKKEDYTEDYLYGSPRKVSESLNDKFKEGFLKDFNFDVQEYKSIKESLGYNNNQMVDLVSKFIAVEEGATMDKSVAYIAFKMLGKQNNKLSGDLKYTIHSWDKYKERFNKHKEVVLKERGYIEDKKEWRDVVRERVIVDFLSEVILEQYNNPTEFSNIEDKRWSKKDFTVIGKFVRWLRKTFSNRKDIQEKGRNIALNIANEVLNNNYDIFNYSLEEGQIQKYYNETIASDPFAKEVVEFAQSKGLVLTGSLALRRAGQVYRTAEENLHDLDFVVPFEKVIESDNNKAVLKKMKKYQGEDVDIASDAARELVTEFDWVKDIKEAYPSYRILHGFYEQDTTTFNTFTTIGVVNGESYDSNGTHKKVLYNGKEITVKHKKGDWIEGTGYLVDNFMRLAENQEEHENYFKLWKEIMIAKLKMGRPKDLIDFKNFVPFKKSKDTFNFFYPEYVYSNNEEVQSPSSQEELQHNSRRTHNSRRATEATEPSNSAQPQGNNYVEFVRYKQNRLSEIENELGRLNFNIRTSSIGTSVDVIQINKEIKSLEKEQTIISRQLESLNQEEAEYMFHAIIEDLDSIELALDSKSVLDANKVSNKLDFLEEFISGKNKKYKGESLDEYANPAFEKIAGRIKTLSLRAEKNILSTARETITNSKGVENLKANNPNLDIEDIFQASKDLNWLESYTLGISADRSNNTIIPQALQSLMRNTLTRKEGTIKAWSSELKALVDAHPELDNPSFIREKDKKGEETGYIIDLFSPAYQVAKRRLNMLLDGFSNYPTEENYVNTLDELLANNDVVDFTQLRVVKDAYESMYPEKFTTSDSQMNSYELDLKRKLGPKYDEVIGQIMNRLALFEDKKIDSITENTDTSRRDLASQNIWDFNEIMQRRAGSIYSQMEYKTEEGTEKVLFKDFANLSFLPKEVTVRELPTDEGMMEFTEKSGFYSEEFRQMAKNPAHLEYWEIIKKMSEYISSTYDSQTYGRLSYPKVQVEYAERLQQGLKDRQFGKIVSGAAKNYKSWFFEKGRFRDENTIVSNYSDSFQSEVKVLSEAYMAQGIEKEVAYSRAKRELLGEYSKDFNSNMIAVAMEAALHDARLEVQPMSEAYIKLFKNVDTDRKLAIKKLEHFYEKIILNVNTKYRGTDSVEGKSLSEDTWVNRALALMERIPFVERMVNSKNTYLLSDAEAKVFKELKIAKDKGIDNKNFTFLNEDGVRYTQRVDSVTGITNAYESIGDQVKEIDPEDFQRYFQTYIEGKISELGLDLNLAGIVNGILKTVIFKGLALSPISGIFNRIEGKHSSMIMDATGEYWTEGNILKANSLMNFANITRLSKGRLTPVWGKRKETLQTFEILMKQFNILQDRKNELQRSAEEANFSRELFNPYMFAVENPEYKNQGAIIMAVMMDTMVTHPVTGEQVPMLDKETGEFSFYNLVDGQLELKPEFQTPSIIEDFQNFRGPQMQALIQQMTDAVSRSQGNYDTLDIMMLKKSMWGRAGTLFMTWFAEHVNQRFGISGDKNYNLATGKKRRDGRFIEAYRTNKLNTSIAAGIGLTVAFGPSLAVLGAAGVGALGFAVYNKFIKRVSNSRDIQQEINYAAELGSFLQSLLIESLNYPGRFFNLGDIKKNNTFNKYEGKNMSKEEIQSMRALTRELAIVLTWLMVKLAMGMLMYDDEDDKESPQRMKFNFVQNQMSRAINTLIMYSNPQELMEDQSRIAVLGVLSDVNKLLLSIFVEKQREDLGKNILNVTPIPRIFTKGVMPWHNKMNYDEMADFSGVPAPMKWTAEMYKNNSIGPEREAQKKYNELRTEIREELRAELMKKHKGKKVPLKKEVDSIMEKRIGKKKKGQTYTEKLKELYKLGY